jgi:hypothetical protein
VRCVLLNKHRCRHTSSLVPPFRSTQYSPRHSRNAKRLAERSCVGLSYCEARHKRTTYLVSITSCMAGSGTATGSVGAIIVSSRGDRGSMKLAGVSIRSIEEDNTTHTLEQQVTLVLQAVEGDRVGSQEQPAYLRTDLPKACCIIHQTASRNQVRKTYFRLALLWLYSLL